MRTLNEVYSVLSARRRYEVWFLRLGLADGGGAWWFRYLLTNPGRGGCSEILRSLPVQVWATWFPRDGKAQTFLQDFPLESLKLSGRAQTPFYFRAGENEIDENSCRGALQVAGHQIHWNLDYRSTFRVTLSNKGWLGFSRTPHSNARFSGEVTLDGMRFAGDPLGFGLQGHNCGYRHRGYWKWVHAHFLGAGASSSTLEALVYDMPLGLVFRKAVLWHDRKKHVFRNLREVEILDGGVVCADQDCFPWNFRCSSPGGLDLDVSIDGSGSALQRVQYVKTDCSGSFEVTNNSLAKAVVRVERNRALIDRLETTGGAVLEMAGPRVVAARANLTLPLVSESAQ
jgi:hypothetical protein